ncbi:hypothetical protein TNCV_4633831 [Trichonephila clavipes]|nr:hypothetical protein TNCV_4633831 [Trichonephila clavipes]
MTYHRTAPSPWASPPSWFVRKMAPQDFAWTNENCNDVTVRRTATLFQAIDDTLIPFRSKMVLDFRFKERILASEIHPEDREKKTAFTSGQGLWQFKAHAVRSAMRQLLSSALMETVLKGLTLKLALFT